MKIHELKTHPEPFEAIQRGLKRFEVRVNDRDFQVGDILCLMEWNPDSFTDSDGKVWGEYTDGDCEVFVTYITRGGEYELPENMVVMSISLMKNGELVR